MNFNPFDAFFLLPAMIVLQQLGHSPPQGLIRLTNTDQV
jgi:hypothetical protein